MMAAYDSLNCKLYIILGKKCIFVAEKCKVRRLARRSTSSATTTGVPDRDVPDVL